MLHLTPIGQPLRLPYRRQVGAALLRSLLTVHKNTAPTSSGWSGVFVYCQEAKRAVRDESGPYSLQGLYMHIKVAMRGVLRLSPNARYHKFSLFTAKCILVENTAFIVKETL